MKRFVALFLLSAGVLLAEDVKLTRNTVMQSGDAKINLKAGTLVKVIEQGDKTVTIKVDGKVGTIPWKALDEVDTTPKMWRGSGPVSVSQSAAVGPRAASTSLSAAAPKTPEPTVIASTPPAAPEPAPEPHHAQTMYGKAVEKARDNAASHEKAMVQPTDEILDGK